MALVHQTTWIAACIEKYVQTANNKQTKYKDTRMYVWILMRKSCHSLCHTSKHDINEHNVDTVLYTYTSGVYLYPYNVYIYIYI